MGLEIDGAMQQAPQAGRQPVAVSIAIGIVIHRRRRFITHG
jgi:hypothetical protein